MITLELYNDILDEADNKIYLNACKTRDAIDSDWWKYNSYFMYPGEKITKKMLQHTTSIGKILSRIPFQLHHKSRNPFLQRTRLSEGYATDTILYCHKL